MLFGTLALVQAVKRQSCEQQVPRVAASKAPLAREEGCRLEEEVESSQQPQIRMAAVAAEHQEPTGPSSMDVDANGDQKWNLRKMKTN